MDSSSKLIDVRCSCGKVTGHLLEKYDRLVARGFENRLIIQNLLSELSPMEVVEELVRQGIVPLYALEIYQRENLSADAMLSRIIRKFSPEGALDEVGAKRYCCRVTVSNPPMIPLGSGLEIGESIRTLEKQEAYRMNNPLRAMSQPQLVSTVQPTQNLQPISRITPNVARRTTSSLQPITRTLNLQQGTQQSPIRAPSRPLLRPLGGTQTTTPLRPITQPINANRQAAQPMQTITRTRF